MLSTMDNESMGNEEKVAMMQPSAPDQKSKEVPSKRDGELSLSLERKPSQSNLEMEANRSVDSKITMKWLVDESRVRSSRSRMESEADSSWETDGSWKTTSSWGSTGSWDSTTETTMEVNLESHRLASSKRNQLLFGIAVVTLLIGAVFGGLVWSGAFDSSSSEDHSLSTPPTTPILTPSPLVETHITEAWTLSLEGDYDAAMQFANTSKQHIFDIAKTFVLGLAENDAMNITILDVRNGSIIIEYLMEGTTVEMRAAESAIESFIGNRTRLTFGNISVIISFQTKEPATSEPTASPTSSSPTTFAPTASSPTSASPTIFPTSNPTGSPSMSPTLSPSKSPTGSPTALPTTGSPTGSPTVSPTTSSPTNSPTASPTTSSPTGSPTASPTTSSPTTSPTASPTTSSPTDSPTAPTITPDMFQLYSPTMAVSKTAVADDTIKMIGEEEENDEIIVGQAVGYVRILYWTRGTTTWTLRPVIGASPMGFFVIGIVNAAWNEDDLNRQLDWRGFSGNPSYRYYGYGSNGCKYSRTANECSNSIAEFYDQNDEIRIELDLDAKTLSWFVNGHFATSHQVLLTFFKLWVGCSGEDTGFQIVGFTQT